MNGQLHDHPLVELIREISAECLSGVLRLARERAKGVVYFDAGRIVAARSNLRAFRLVECLRRWRVVTSERLASIVTETMTDEETAAALVAAGALDATGMEIVRARQGAETLSPMLLWTDGEWSFDPLARLDETTHAPLDVTQLLLDGARRLPFDFIAARMSVEEMLSPTVQDAPAGAQLLPVEAFVRSRVDAPMRVGEVVAITSGVPEPQVQQALYVLALARLLQRERWPRIFSPEAVARELKRPLNATTGAAASAPAANAANAANAASATTTTGRPMPEAVKDDQPAPAAPTEADPSDELDALFALAASSSYYEIFSVGRKANTADIKRAYYGLAKRFHPDRFHHETDAALRARIEQAFSKIAQAYETLKDSALRATYDLKLETQLRRGGTLSPVAPPPVVESTQKTARAQSQSPTPPTAKPTTTPPPPPPTRQQQTCFSTARGSSITGATPHAGGTDAPRRITRDDRRRRRAVVSRRAEFPAGVMGDQAKQSGAGALVSERSGAACAPTGSLPGALWSCACERPALASRRRDRASGRRRARHAHRLVPHHARRVLPRQRAAPPRRKRTRTRALGRTPARRRAHHAQCAADIGTIKKERGNKATGKSHRRSDGMAGSNRFRLIIEDMTTTQIEFTESERVKGEKFVRLAATTDEFEGYAHPHAVRVAVIADELAKVFRLARADRSSLRFAALLHDIGEATMKRDYIKRPGALSEAERLDLARHPVIGEQEAARADADRGAQLLVRWHHEWWNGTGYPDALRNEQIPLAARILRVADAYAALTDARPFRPAGTEVEACKHLTLWAGLEFDPRVVHALLALDEFDELRSYAQAADVAPPNPAAGTREPVAGEIVGTDDEAAQTVAAADNVDTNAAPRLEV